MAMDDLYLRDIDSEVSSFIKYSVYNFYVGY